MSEAPKDCADCPLSDDMDECGRIDWNMDRDPVAVPTDRCPFVRLDRASDQSVLDSARYQIGMDSMREAVANRDAIITAKDAERDQQVEVINRLLVTSEEQRAEIETLKLCAYDGEGRLNEARGRIDELIAEIERLRARLGSQLEGYGHCGYCEDRDVSVEDEPCLSCVEPTTTGGNWRRAVALGGDQ